MQRKRTHRKNSMPYMTAMISTGYDDLKRDTLKLDGPLVPSMKKLIEKYGIPPEALFCAIVLPASYGCFMSGVFVMLAHAIGLSL